MKLYFLQLKQLPLEKELALATVKYYKACIFITVTQSNLYAIFNCPEKDWVSV